MRRALVTGITGQTGSYLAEQLSADGWEVHGLIRPADTATSALEQYLPTAHLHEADLADADAVRRAVDTVQPSTIFNLGGISSVARSWEHPLETATITGLAVGVLLDAALGVQERSGERVSFVQASSAEIFGSAQVVPQNEVTPVIPSNPYGAAKAYGHHLVGVYRTRGLDAASCILFNHESPRRPPTFVTRKITRAAARIKLGLQDRLSLGNLDARRDWGWAPDYARALAAAASVPDDFVIATGTAHSVRDFVASAFLAAGVDDWENRIDIDPRYLRHGDSALQVGDASKAHEVLGWNVTHTFAEMIQAMVEADLAESAAHG